MAPKPEPEPLWDRYRLAASTYRNAVVRLDSVRGTPEFEEAFEEAEAARIVYLLLREKLGIDSN